MDLCTFGMLLLQHGMFLRFARIVKGILSSLLITERYTIVWPCQCVCGGQELHLQSSPTVADENKSTKT